MWLLVNELCNYVRFRTVGVCTEKWVEVIRASKQTDTEDFAFKVEHPLFLLLFFYKIGSSNQRIEQSGISKNPHDVILKEI